MDGFIATPSVCVFLTFDPLSLIGFRSFLVLILTFQAAVRGSSFNRTICLQRARLSIRLIKIAFPCLNRTIPAQFLLEPGFVGSWVCFAPRLYSVDAHRFVGMYGKLPRTLSRRQ